MHGARRRGGKAVQNLYSQIRLGLFTEISYSRSGSVLLRPVFFCDRDDAANRTQEISGRRKEGSLRFILRTGGVIG